MVLVFSNWEVGLAKVATRAIVGQPAYDMAGANARLPLRGGLINLTTVGADGKPHDVWTSEDRWYVNWIDPEMLEAALAADAGVRKAVDKALAAGVASPTTEARALVAIRKEIDRVFDEVVLVDIMQRFAAVSGDVARYMLARKASGIHNEEL
jgi:hypothetical protein